MINRSENELALNQAELKRRRRSGCLGCLGQSLAALLFGVVLLGAVTAALKPWAFYMGGSFHVIPYWQGWGILRGQSGDYPLFVRFEPSFRRGSRIYSTSRLQGIAYLCTPRGERFRMKLTGDMRSNLPRNIDGEAISLYMDNWPALTGQFLTHHRPSIELRGHWKNPDLVMDDHASLYRAFNPDGSVIENIPANRPYNGPVVSVTIKPEAYAEFNGVCKSTR